MNKHGMLKATSVAIALLKALILKVPNGTLYVLKSGTRIKI